MHVAAAAAAVRNHSVAVARAMLEVEMLVVGPYASGLSCLVEDEMNLGVTVIDMGGGTTSVNTRLPPLRISSSSATMTVTPFISSP